MSTRTLRLVVEYTGTHFAGWQVQPDQRTVQGELRRALETILRAPVELVGASRTDSGVHAQGQVASFVTDQPLSTRRILRGVNALVPEDMAVRAVEEVPEGFHARFSAEGKHYRYRLIPRGARSPWDRETAWHVPRGLDVEAMAEGARALVGFHDFRTFVSRPDGDGDCRRTLLAVEVARRARGDDFGWCGRWAEEVTVDVVGDGFLYKMVRTLVGTLVQVGLGEWSPGRVREALEARDRAAGGPTAPPQGLCLMRVFYGGVLGEAFPGYERTVGGASGGETRHNRSQRDSSRVAGADGASASATRGVTQDATARSGA